MAATLGISPSLMLRAGSPGEAAVWRAVLERAAQIRADDRIAMAQRIAYEVLKGLGA